MKAANVPILGKAATALVFLAVAFAPAVAAEPQVHTVFIADMKFGPMPKQVRAGDVILWVNRDVVRHTATAPDGSFNVDLKPGAGARSVVRRAGRLPVFCKYHPGMIGQLVVAPG